MRSELMAKLEKALEFSETQLSMERNPYDELIFLQGKRAENTRLKPLHEKLLDCVRALKETHYCHLLEHGKGPCKGCDTLAALAKACE